MNFHNLGLFLSCILASVPVAIIVIAFRLILQEADTYRTTMLLSEIAWWQHAIIILIMWLIVWLTQKIVKYYPLTMGSGIPQTSEIAVGRLGIIAPIKNLAVKFFGGILSIGMGFSLSRGGPAVEMGSFAGRIFGLCTKMRAIEQRYLQVATGCAGLSAAFTTPLSATIFTLEGITHQMSIKNVVAALLAAGTAGWIAVTVYPNNAYQAIDISSPHGIPVLHTGIILLCFALLIALLGKLFNFSLIQCQKRYIKSKLRPQYKLLGIVVLIYSTGLWIPSIIGDGESFLLNQGTTSIGIQLLLILIIIKILLTTICYSPGLPGGIFLPLLVIGGLTGKLFGMALAALGIISISVHYGFFMILGMAGFFVATVRAPITGIVFTVEVTQQFGALFPAIIFVSLTFFLSQVISTKPIYDTLYDELIKSQQKDNIPISIDFTINHGSFLLGKRVKNIPMPDGCRLIAVKRQKKSMDFASTLCADDVLTIEIPSMSLEQLFPVFNALVKEN